MSDYIGSTVTINCGSAVGHCQGVVKGVDQKSQTITISNPFQNGIKSPEKELTLRSSNIVEITIIDSLLEKPAQVEKPSTPSQKGKAKSKGLDHQHGWSNNGYADPSPQKFSTTSRKQNVRSKKGLYRQTEDCFSTNVADMTEDFDFAKNLAMFDKAAVYQEINSGSDGEVLLTPSKNRRKREEKYRHDEFVLQKGPVVFRQIITNEPEKAEIEEYYTDAGLVVPTVSHNTLNQILHAAELMGFTAERQAEIFGANASLMALTLLGGLNRLHPRNSHQPPSVLVTCGPHWTGALGVAVARHLSNHNVKVSVFLPHFVKIHPSLQEELGLLSLTHATIINDYSLLPATPVDLILSAMDEDGSDALRQQPWYQHAVRWCNGNRAPLMCLAPPPTEASPDLHIKWSICAVLPFSFPLEYGTLYMVDMGIPVRAYEKVGIQYQSPFCGKSSLRLNRNNK